MKFQAAITVARYLLEAHLPHSAERLLDAVDGYGREYNALRSEAQRRAARTEIKPGVYALVTASRLGCPEAGELGLVVPFDTAQGDQCGADVDDEAQHACRRAVRAATRNVESGRVRLPILRPVLPRSMRFEGKSLGLPAALAFVARYTGLCPQVPVLATGDIQESDLVGPVGNVRAKSDAAVRELGGGPGVLLVPRENRADVPGDAACEPVADLRKALLAVWRNQRLHAHHSLLSFDGLIERVEKTADHDEALRLLDSVDPLDLSESDRAVRSLHRGVRLRHSGRTEESEQAFVEMSELLGAVERIGGPAQVETMRVERLATSVGWYDFEPLTRQLEQLLEAPFQIEHNRVRCQGILAQVCSLRGEHDRAIELRLKNLGLQHGSDRMRRERPRTLCYLTFEAARGGRRPDFDRYGDQLMAETPPGDPVQTRYNNNAVVRGMLLLGRCDELWDCLQRRERLWGVEPGWLLLDLLGGQGVIQGYPDVSTARALVRLLRARKEPQAAVDLAERVAPVDDRQPLLAWIRTLVDVERALAEADVGDDTAANRRLDEARQRLRRLHPGAYDHHLTGFDKLRIAPSMAGEIERLLDGVYY
ncbi:MAG: hypothetical protein R6V85_05015 [Polyangia bacterium]